MNCIITGSTGMIGKAVLLECLESPEVTSVLLFNRQSIQIEHPKIREIILRDFMKLQSVADECKGYDACFFCMGVSSSGMTEEQYHQLTYGVAKEFATLLYSLNPNMVFNFVSGEGTDSSEKGNLMWARVKGKTENMILNMGFKDAYMFRIGTVIPQKGVTSKTGWTKTMYTLARPLFPLLKNLSFVTTSVKVGQAMINTLRFPQQKKILRNQDINLLAEKHL